VFFNRNPTVGNRRGKATNLRMRKTGRWSTAVWSTTNAANPIRRPTPWHMTHAHAAIRPPAA